MEMDQGEWARVAIIVLNWNGWRDTIECLESLYQITYPNYDIVVVDNGSEDESIDKIREYCDGKMGVKSEFFDYEPSNKPIEIIEYMKSDAESAKEKTITDLPPNRKMILIKNEENYGFPEGNNIAIKYAINALTPDYVLLLNNDTVVDKDFLGELVKIGESDEKVGIVGPKIYYYDDPRRIWSNSPKKNIGKIDGGECKDIIEVKWVAGCAFFIKMSVINKVGLLDADLFLYCEETDYCMRVEKAGYKMYITDNSLIWHKESLRGKTKPYQIYYENRNSIIVRYKNYSRINFYIFIIVYIFIVRSLSMFRFLKDKRYYLIIPMLLGIKDGVLWCFSMAKAGRNPSIPHSCPLVFG